MSSSTTSASRSWRQRVAGDSCSPIAVRARGHRPEQGLSGTRERRRRLAATWTTAARGGRALGGGAARAGPLRLFRARGGAAARTALDRPWLSEPRAVLRRRRPDHPGDLPPARLSRVPRSSAGATRRASSTGLARYLPWRALAASGHHVLAGWVALVYLAWAVGVPGGAILLTRGLLVSIGAR